jgi:hypothetical protein
MCVYHGISLRKWISGDISISSYWSALLKLSALHNEQQGTDRDTGKHSRTPALKATPRALEHHGIFHSTKAQHVEKTLVLPRIIHTAESWRLVW